jgi:hypothetical protein
MDPDGKSFSIRKAVPVMYSTCHVGCEAGHVNVHQDGSGLDGYIEDSAPEGEGGARYWQANGESGT